MLQLMFVNGDERLLESTLFGNHSFRHRCLQIIQGRGHIRQWCIYRFFPIEVLYQSLVIFVSIILSWSLWKWIAFLISCRMKTLVHWFSRPLCKLSLWNLPFRSPLAQSHYGKVWLWYSNYYIWLRCYYQILFVFSYGILIRMIV